MFKVGDIVKMDLDIIMKYNPSKDSRKWYSDKSFTIIGITGDSVLLNEDITHYKVYGANNNLIWKEFIKLDIVAMRKKKLERLKDV